MSTKNSLCFLASLVVKGFTLLLLLSPINLSGQEENALLFEELLTLNQLVLEEDLVTDFKVRAISEQRYFSSQYTLYSRKQGLEIQFLVQNLDSNNVLNNFPHLKANALVTHLATNEGQNVIAAHEISITDIQEQFHADWASLFYFQPKASFSTAAHCRLLVLYKEDSLLAYVCFLFDKVPLDLNKFLYVLKFAS